MNTHSCKFDVLGLGVSTLDLMLLVDEFAVNETVQCAHRSILQGGGPVATAMVTLARLGAKCAMVDQLGDDWISEKILNDFRKEGVNSNWISVIKGGTSSISSNLVRKRDGARAFVYSPGNVCDLDVEKISEDIISSAAILHVNGRHWNACCKAVKIAKECGVKVSFDGGAHRYRPELIEIMKMCDICIVAREFGCSFSKNSEIEIAAKSLSDLGPKLVVITDGPLGSWIFQKDEKHFYQPAFKPKHVVDTTGAGDAYHGAFLFGLVNNYSVRKSAIFASAVAAINTHGLGGRSALPSLNNVEEFIRLSEELKN